ncbi:hypothetical protein C8R44DRAFT_892171 [Mycena epipterygia]|nr:hypothetical protein C8R44DRAFT_892783 [Mycena epipterygia]KAJ7089987.1 hypothetical protein C8R44DRAFT_892171 [Mycena epipterygia]
MEHFFLERVHRDPSQKHTYYDDDETVALAQQMLSKYEADGKDPLDDMPNLVDMIPSTVGDDYDPHGGLPYFPRPDINIRHMNALCLISGAMARLDTEKTAAKREARAKRLTPWPHMRVEMIQVAAQIIEVGAAKRSAERQEVGPAPIGFCYVQIRDQVYLVEDGGDGSMIYVAEAATVVIRNR